MSWNIDSILRGNRSSAQCVEGRVPLISRPRTLSASKTPSSCLAVRATTRRVMRGLKQVWTSLRSRLGAIDTALETSDPHNSSRSSWTLSSTYSSTTARQRPRDKADSEADADADSSTRQHFEKLGLNFFFEVCTKYV